MPVVVLPRRRSCAGAWGELGGRTVAEAMVTEVKLGNASTTVGQVRRLFEDEHVHAAVIVQDGVLLAVVDRADLDHVAADEMPAVRLGAVHGRVIPADGDLAEAAQFMIANGRRRLAVVGPDGALRGLLCLKRTLDGFCADGDVRARRQPIMIECRRSAVAKDLQ